MREGLVSWMQEWAFAWPWLLDGSIKVTVWLLFVWFVCVLLRRSSAGLRHAVLMVSMLMIPVILLLGSFPRTQDFAWRPMETITEFREWTVGELEAEPLEVGSRIAIGEPDSKAGEGLSTERLDGRGMVVAFWGLGMLIAAVGLMGRIRKPKTLQGSWAVAADEALCELLRREAVRLGLGKVPALRMVDQGMPMTVGLINQQIVLPREAGNWEREKVVAILRHELAHIFRGDLRWILLSEVCWLPVWWHPVAWKLRRESAELREQACDDVVLREGSDPGEYAQHLISLLPGVPRLEGRGLAALALGRAGRMKRFRRVLNHEVRRTPVSREALAGLIAMALLLVLPGSLLVSCSSKRDGDGEVETPSVDFSEAPKLPPVPSIARELKISLKVYDFALTPEASRELPLLAELSSGKTRVLSLQEGWSVFHPQRTGIDMLAAPQIVVEAGRRASVDIVREIVYPVSAKVDPATGKTTLEEFDTLNVGVMLGIRARPTEQPDELEVRIEPVIREFLGFDEPKDPGELPKPKFVTLGEPYEGRLENGGYLFVGKGLKSLIIEDKTPVLGDLPLVGSLFRKEEVQSLERYVAVQVTVSEASENQYSTLKPSP